MHKVIWSLDDTTVHLPTYLLLIKNERLVVYDTPEYNKLRDKEDVADNLRHLSRVSSELSLLLIQFSGSDTSKVDLGGGGGRDNPGSSSALCLSQIQRTPMHKREVESADGKCGSKGKVRQWGEET